MIINNEAKGDIYKRQSILFTVAVYAGSLALGEDSNDQQMR